MRACFHSHRIARQNVRNSARFPLFFAERLAKNLKKVYLCSVKKTQKGVSYGRAKISKRCK